MTTRGGETFTCWKEIAAYLGKGVRTVQRWENQFGLPVQRPNALSKGMVRASRKDLDEWMQREWSHRAIQTAKRAVPVELRESPTTKSIAKLRDLQAANHELLKQFKESLRVLNTSCEQLRGIVRQKEDQGRGAGAD